MHQTAGGLGVVLEERAHLLGGLRLGSFENRLPIGLLHLGEQIDAIVALELFEDFGRRIGPDLLDCIRSLTRGKILEQLDRQVAVQDVEKPRQIPARQMGGRVGSIELAPLLEAIADLVLGTLLEQILELLPGTLAHSSSPSLSDPDFEAGLIIQQMTATDVDDEIALERHAAE